jgi:hypothetical protein
MVSLFLGSDETSLNNIPVDNIPDGLDVIRTHVTVGKVICMLPHLAK